VRSLGTWYAALIGRAAVEQSGPLPRAAALDKNVVERERAVISAETKGENPSLLCEESEMSGGVSASACVIRQLTKAHALRDTREGGDHARVAADRS
jgi:hypothetical protein